MAFSLVCADLREVHWDRPVFPLRNIWMKSSLSVFQMKWKLPMTHLHIYLTGPLPSEDVRTYNEFCRTHCAKYQLWRTGIITWQKRGWHGTWDSSRSRAQIFTLQRAVLCNIHFGKRKMETKKKKQIFLESDLTAITGTENAEQQLGKWWGGRQERNHCNTKLTVRNAQITYVTILCYRRDVKVIINIMVVERHTIPERT